MTWPSPKVPYSMEAFSARSLWHAVAAMKIAVMQINGERVDVDVMPEMTIGDLAALALLYKYIFNYVYSYILIQILVS